MKRTRELKIETNYGMLVISGRMLTSESIYQGNERETYHIKNGVFATQLIDVTEINEAWIINKTDGSTIKINIVRYLREKLNGEFISEKIRWPEFEEMLEEPILNEVELAGFYGRLIPNMGSLTFEEQMKIESENNFKEKAAEYGIVKYKNKEYALIEEVVGDSQLGYDNDGFLTRNYGEIEDGTTYELILKAKAIGMLGGSYYVEFRFEQDKGNEFEELDMFDLEDESAVYEVSEVF
jgi:hypothetical protein